MKTIHWTACLALAVLLSGCGGGDAPEPPVAGRAVPASATASPTAYATFIGGLAADDRAAPLDLEGVEPPVSDTAGPIDLDG